jgi:hypothetical protein
MQKGPVYDEAFFFKPIKQKTILLDWVLGKFQGDSELQALAIGALFGLKHVG